MFRAERIERALEDASQRFDVVRTEILYRRRWNVHPLVNAVPQFDARRRHDERFDPPVVAGAASFHKSARFELIDDKVIHDLLDAKFVHGDLRITIGDKPYTGHLDMHLDEVKHEHKDEAKPAADSKPAEADGPKGNAEAACNHSHPPTVALSLAACCGTVRSRKRKEMRRSLLSRKRARSDQRDQ